MVNLQHGPENLGCEEGHIRGTKKQMVGENEEWKLTSLTLTEQIWTTTRLQSYVLPEVRGRRLKAQQAGECASISYANHALADDATDC
jgi:hypothetical protein